MKPVAARSRVVKWNPLDRRTRARTASPNQVVLHLDAATQARPFGTTGGVLPAAAVAGRQASMLHARTHTDDLVADKYTSVPSADLDPLQQHHRAISMPAQTLRQWTRQRLPPPMDSDFPVELIRSHSRPGSSPAVVPVSPTSTASTADHSRSNSRNNAPPVWSAETMVPPPAIPSYPAQLSSQPEVVIESKPDVWTSDDKHHVPVQIVYENIKFEVEITKNKTTEKRPILKGCSGSFEPGRFTAVMGASGAGKTSLMNIISGNRTAGKHEGMLKINGQDVFDQPKRMREISAFIMQDDILLGTQTVREAIILSARLRLPKSMPDADKITRADEVIDLLGLRKCQDTIIGDRFHKGVSGGEKRRVSMALELVKSPSVLFLDEPTSGLDTFTSYSIIQLLRDLAHSQGTTVVCTIHQPSSDTFYLFDDLCLIADGRVMYHGPAKEVVPYFQARGLSCPENFNPADFLFTTVLYSMDEQLKMISHDMEAAAAKTQRAHARRQSMALLLTDRIVDNKTKYEQMQRSEAARLEKLLLAWTNSSENAELERKIKSPLTTPLPDRSLLRAERPSQWYAFSLLAQRRWYDLLRHRMKVRVTFGQHLFFAVLIGTIFLRTGTNQNNIQDRTGGCFFICVQTLMMSYLSNLSTFGPDKIVMQREMESGLYRLPAFFFSRWIVELPFRIIFPIVYSAILYFMVGLQEVAEKFALFTLALILLNNCGTAFAVMICSAFPEVQQAMQFGPMFMLPLLVFSGLYVNLTTLGWYFRWLAYISPIRYGYGAVIKTEMDGLEFTCEAGASSCIKTGAQVIRGLGIADDPTAGQNLMILTGVLMFYLSAGYFFMWRTTKKR